MATVVTNLNPNTSTDLSAPKEPLTTTAINENKDTLHIINVDSFSQKEKTKAFPGDELWYNSLRAWIFIGVLPSLVFIYLAFKDIYFLILLPAGPLIGWASWHIRRLAKRYNPYKEDYLK